jgi:hypothetical protein
MRAMTFFLALLLRPLVLVVLFWLILRPARLAVQSRMNEGALKRFLLFPVGSKPKT